MLSDKRTMWFVVVGCLLLSLLGYAWKERTSLPFVTGAAELLTTPFTYGSARALYGVRTGIEIVDEVLGNHEELLAFREAAERDGQTAVDVQELQAENMRLRRLLQYANRSPQFDMTVASVIMRDFGGWTNTMTIDRGAAEGITPRMAVVVPSGVVGFVSDVYEHSARVQTLLDPRTAVGVIVQRPESRVAAVMEGRSVAARPVMVNIASEGDVLAGDTLITSGFGGLYPKGLIVGHVTELREDAEGFVKHATVLPSVDFSALEEVIVIRYSAESAPVLGDEEPRLVPRTQRDKVEGAKGAVAQ